MTSSRRAARGAAAPKPEEINPNRVYAKSMQTPRGPVRAWFRHGECHKVRVQGVTYGWGEGPAVWAALQDGTFRPADFGKHNDLRWAPSGARPAGAGDINDSYSEGEDLDY